jgi:hypothetical protein
MKLVVPIIAQHYHWRSPVAPSRVSDMEKVSFWSMCSYCINQKLKTTKACRFQVQSNVWRQVAVLRDMDINDVGFPDT